MATQRYITRTNTSSVWSFVIRYALGVFDRHGAHGTGAKRQSDPQPTTGRKSASPLQLGAMEGTGAAEPRERGLISDRRGRAMGVGTVEREGGMRRMGGEMGGGMMRTGGHVKSTNLAAMGNGR